jgi:hypothetical protein
MRKWKQLFLVSGLALCFGMAAKGNAQAAGQVTGVKQIDDSKSMIEVECDAVLGADKYFLELSQDGKTWVTVDASANPKISAYNLNAGKSYYARMGLCTDWEGEDKIAGSESAPIEVVTAPDGTMDVVQADARTNGVSVKSNAVAGANLYRLYCDKVLLGQSANTAVASTAKMNAGTSYYCYLYACRKSASGYVAIGSYDYETFKTLAPAFNTKGFGISQTWENINSYQFSASSAYAKDGVQFQFLTPGGKAKKNVYRDDSSGTTSTIVDKFINGYFYKYRVRPYVMCGTRRVFGGWSGYKYIGVAKKVSTKFNKKKKYVTLSISKVSNASSFTVYASTKANSGFKKVKTISAKKRSVTIKKVAGKKLKRNKYYYFKIVPNAKAGKKTVKSGYTQTFSWRYYRVF